ncbi:MAG: HAMP domain-containing histidine kinase, partial [Asticcacaulis sp.]|nr:HAMP domain-containing histidine kinase [Asticcacaulis sp.]
FLEQITNELKTPLNNILGYARLINEHRHDNPDIASYTQNLMKSAKALQSMVKDTIETTALETAPSVRETGHAHTTEESVNIVGFVKDLVNQFSPLAQTNQTRLNAHFVDFDNSWAQMDVMRVRQIVQNLLSNAVKFTKGGLINVTASQVMVDNGTWLRVSVRDTGIGMSEEQAHGLFGGNIHDLNGNRVSGGGIGLSIAKAIVDLLGGHIGVVSRIGEGSNFWFEIPVNWVDAPARTRMSDVTPAPLARTVNRVPGADPMRPAATVAAARPPVDEDRINREYLRALLEDMKLDIG